MCQGSRGECDGNNCVQTSGCSSCIVVSGQCTACNCGGGGHGGFEPAGRVVSKSTIRPMSKKAQAEYDSLAYWKSGIQIEKPEAKRLQRLGIQMGDLIVKIDGKQATDARMRKFINRSKPHRGTVMVSRVTESRIFVVPYRVIPQ